jgi:ferredoxin
MSFTEQREQIKSACVNAAAKGYGVLAFAESGGQSVPAVTFFRQTEELNALKWDGYCSLSLAKYLLKNPTKKTAVVAKACDARGIAVLLNERQIERENVYIIGAECAGMLDKSGAECAHCKQCDSRKPPIFDEYIALSGGVKPRADKAKVKGDFARFKKELDKCILCFACRQACSGCYCKTCFVDRGAAGFIGETLSENKMIYHLGRAMHLAGRCSGCGSCETACPSGVNIRYLIKDLSDFCLETYGASAGESLGVAAATVTYSDGDTEPGFYKRKEF